MARKQEQVKNGIFVNFHIFFSISLVHLINFKNLITAANTYFSKMHIDLKKKVLFGRLIKVRNLNLKSVTMIKTLAGSKRVSA